MRIRHHDTAYPSLFTVIITTTLLVFIPFSAMGDGGRNVTSTSSVIIDNSDLPGDIGDRVDNLISSAINATGDREINIQLSGNIASARFNLSTGQIEQTFFGNWSADIQTVNNASFSADFGARGSNGTEEAHYRIGNLTLNSFQRINEHVALGGTVDVSEEVGMQSWKGTPASVVVISGKELIVSFEDPELSEAFSNQSITGIVSP